MNLIEYYKEKGLSIEGERQINMIVGCIVASDLNNQDKRELIDFMRAIEDYITGDIGVLGMNEINFSKYVLSECERQWKDNQEEVYGSWESQSDDTKAEYYNDMYTQLLSRLGERREV